MTSLSLMDYAAVRAALGQRVADAKFLTKGRRNAAPADDSDALLNADDTVETVPAVFHLTYEDSGGQVSERVVTVRRIERRVGGFYLHGLCHLRGAPRCFSAERILEVFDAGTGEVVDNPTTFFEGHPIYVAPRDPVGEAIKICKHEINLLTVVGASDGLFDPDEQDVLLVHVFNRCDHLQLDEVELRRLLALIAPDHRAFEGSLAQMSRFRAGDPLALRRTLRKMVEADGVIAPGEVAFVHEIQSALGV